MAPRSKAEELDVFADRAAIPEREPIHLPDDWRADKPQVPCQLCGWTGIWSDLTSSCGRPIGSNEAIEIIDLEQSASNGNFCCVVLFALAQKFSVLVGGLSFANVWFRTEGSGELMVSHEGTNIEDIYVSWGSEGEIHAPPGVKAYSGHPFTEPWSDKTLAWAKGRVEDCALNHDCSTAFISKRRLLPTRLIHIPMDFQVRGVCLIDNTTSLPEDTRYAALSHCWGKATGKECLTTVDNVASHLNEGISWTEVPQTFRDAIHYTHRMGLEYIWIDSLCIVQKDATDWEKESTRMFDYYSNAYITLGSTFSTNCSGGFFSQQHIRASRLYLFDMVFRGTKFHIYARRPFFSEKNDLNYAENTDGGGPGMLNSPFHLFKRAWTFQERLVSPRLLLFTEHQLTFECYAGRWLQETSSITRDTHKSKYRRLLTSSGVDSAEVSWTDLLRSFTVLHLSHATDKLPAFAALAQQYIASQTAQSHVAGGGYLCGLRKSHLHCDLLWLPINHGLNLYEGHDLKNEPLCFGETYFAPSWSWASVPRPTTYGDTNYFGAGRGDGKSTVTLLSDNLVFTEAGRFGRALEGSYIVLQGPVLDCFLHRWTPGSDLDLISGGHCLRLENGWETPNFRFEPDFARGYGFSETDGDVKLCLLQCWVHEEEDKAGMLVLHKSSRNNRYHRVGVCMRVSGDHVWPYLKGHFRDAPQRVLEIE